MEWLTVHQSAVSWSVGSASGILSVVGVAWGIYSAFARAQAAARASRSTLRVGGVEIEIRGDMSEDDIHKAIREATGLNRLLEADRRDG